MPAMTRLLVFGFLLAALLPTRMCAEWKPLFDGSSLKGWTPTPFGGAGEVEVKDGHLVLNQGILTGITWTNSFPTNEYEIELEARRVLGIDVDIRPHNRQAIEAHPLASRIEMIQGSSIADDVVAAVRRRAADFTRVMVLLDSNHTHAHVLAELEAYAPLVSPGSYCEVFDTNVDEMPNSAFPDRPWGPGDNPKTAVRSFLASHPEFAIDAGIHQKLLVTVAPEGFLKRLG
jgi:cephalosporin hydroxylase